MAIKAVVTVASLVFLLVLPALEVNTTHLFNPHWPEHARLHEAWQLLTNAGLGVLCLWLTSKEANARLGATIMLILTFSFLIALVAAPLYGGSMLHTDGAELKAFGVNIAVVVMGFLCAALAVALVLESRPQSLRKSHSHA